MVLNAFTETMRLIRDGEKGDGGVGGWMGGGERLYTYRNTVTTSFLHSGSRQGSYTVTDGGLSRSNSNPWWNKECEEAVRLKRVMYRHYSKDQNAETHEEMKAANRDCNKIIAQAKKDPWIAFADSISAGKADLGSMWKKIRRMKQQCVVPDSDLQHGSTKYTTTQSKADALAKAFAEASDTDSLPADRQQFRREMEATFMHPVQMTVWRLTPHWPAPS